MQSLVGLAIYHRRISMAAFWMSHFQLFCFNCSDNNFSVSFVSYSFPSEICLTAKCHSSLDRHCGWNQESTSSCRGRHVVLAASSSQGHLKLGPATPVDSNQICRVIQNTRFIYSPLFHHCIACLWNLSNMIFSQKFSACQLCNPGWKPHLKRSWIRSCSSISTCRFDTLVFN